MEQTICALCLPKKMELNAKCNVRSQVTVSQKSNNRKAELQLALLLDPRYAYLTHKPKTGGRSAGKI